VRIKIFPVDMSENIEIKRFSILVFQILYLIYMYKTTHLVQQIARDRYEEGFNSTFGLVSFLLTNSCNLSCYIKKSVWFCIYYTSYMFFSNV